MSISMVKHLQYSCPLSRYASRLTMCFCNDLPPLPNRLSDIFHCLQQIAQVHRIDRSIIIHVLSYIIQIYIHKKDAIECTTYKTVDINLRVDSLSLQDTFRISEYFFSIIISLLTTYLYISSIIRSFRSPNSMDLIFKQTCSSRES